MCEHLHIAMAKPSRLMPAKVAPPPVADVLNVARYERTSPDHCFTATSKPGHLLQYLVQGRVIQTCNGRHYDLRAGDLIWYHEDEWVEGQAREAPWVYYSVSFLAPALPPPPYEARVVQRPARRMQPLFDGLVRAWQITTEPAFVRSCRVHAALLEVLARLDHAAAGLSDTTPTGGLWWELEERIRDNLACRVSLSDLERWSGRGQATIVRACRAAVGQSPMRRVKQIRMSYARGLVRHGDLNISQIADRLGYPRVHEFSRDYRQHFGHPPTHEAAPCRDQS
jgi:AraC-like DNA-binding protein